MPSTPFAHQAPRRRGVAMLLVLISMMMATILTVAYLASRDNSAVIGENVANSAAARHVSESGLELGKALLQTRTDWRTGHTNGNLVDDLNLSTGTVDLDLLDLATGLPPTETTEDVRLTSTATVDGVEQSSTALVWVPPATSAVDVDLSEFALFAATRITLANQATVTRWPTAPLSKLGQVVTLGTQTTTANTVSLANDATVIDGRVFTGPTPSNSLLSVANGTRLTLTSLKDTIPMPKAPDTGVADPLVISLYPAMNLTGGTTVQTATSRVSKATLSNAVRTLRGNITLVSDDDLELTSNAKLLIDGDVEIVVFKALTMDTGSIELKPGATLKLFVGDKITLNDAYIGDARTDAARDNTGAAPYMDPERVQVYRIASRAARVDWRLDGNSVVKGSVYGPQAKVSILQTSALYGSVAAHEIALQDSGSVFYDPQLNSRSGYTEPDSEVFNADATLKTAIKTLASLDVSGLQSLADLLGLNIRQPGNRLLTLLSATAPVDVPPTAGPTEPTPRPVKIAWQMTGYGSETSQWEVADAGEGPTPPLGLDD